MSSYEDISRNADMDLACIRGVLEQSLRYSMDLNSSFVVMCSAFVDA